MNFAAQVLKELIKHRLPPNIMIDIKDDAQGQSVRLSSDGASNRKYHHQIKTIFPAISLSRYLYSAYINFEVGKMVYALHRALLHNTETHPGIPKTILEIVE